MWPHKRGVMTINWSINSHNTSETCTEHGGSKHVAIYTAGTYQLL